jgi:2-C-methyl-D-erythritol 4-phosphate cytidylyltransferase
MRVVALVLAAGQGRRMGAETNKPYLLLAGKPILFHTLHEFEECPSIEEVVLIVEKHEIEYARSSIVEAFGCSKVTSIVAGGLKRQDSVWEGIKAIKGDCELVMVHDGVRPFISQLQTLDRKTLWSVQTPQTFNHDLLKRAHEKARQDGFYGTDDASLVERIGVTVRVVDGSYENIKITTPEDLVIGESILKK